MAQRRAALLASLLISSFIVLGRADPSDWYSRARSDCTAHPTSGIRPHNSLSADSTTVFTVTVDGATKTVSIRAKTAGHWKAGDVFCCACKSTQPSLFVP